MKKTYILFTIILIILISAGSLIIFNKKDAKDNNNNVTEKIKDSLPEFPILDSSIKSLSIIDQKDKCIEKNCQNINPFTFTQDDITLNDFNITLTCTNQEKFSEVNDNNFCFTYKVNINNIIKFNHEVGDYEPTGLYILKTNDFYIIEEGIFGNLYGIGKIHIYNTSGNLLKTITNTVTDFNTNELNTTNASNPLGTYKITISDNKLYYLTTDNINDESNTNKVHFNYIDLKDGNLTSTEYNSIKAITSNEID